MRLALRFAVLTLSPFLSGEASAETPMLNCGGAEPYWSLAMSETEGVFTSPETPQIDYSIQHRVSAEGRRWPEVLTLLAPTDTALVILRPASCGAEDWMVDILTQRVGEAIALTGCCRVRPRE